MRCETQLQELKKYQVQRGSYSSPSSSSELSAEKSKTGPLLARGGGGVGSLGRLAEAVVALARDGSAPAAAVARGATGAEAAACEDPAPAETTERVTRCCG